MVEVSFNTTTPINFSHELNILSAELLRLYSVILNAVFSSKETHQTPRDLGR